MRDHDAELAEAIPEVPSSSVMHSSASSSPIRPADQLTSRRQRTLMDLPVNAMKTETEIRAAIEPLRSLTTLQLKEKYREAFGEQSMQSQAVLVPPHRLAHPGERVTPRSAHCWSKSSGVGM